MPPSQPVDAAADGHLGTWTFERDGSLTAVGDLSWEYHVTDTKFVLSNSIKDFNREYLWEFKGGDPDVLRLRNPDNNKLAYRLVREIR